MLAQSLGLSDPVHAYHEAEAACVSGRDSRERVLEDGGGLGLDVEHLRGLKERVGCRLAVQPAFVGDLRVDPHVEKVCHAARLEYRLGVRA
jgi:hypothetical protein